MPTQPIPPKPFTGWAVYRQNGEVLPSTISQTEEMAGEELCILFLEGAKLVTLEQAKSAGFSILPVTVTPAEGSK
jgi:hypothetical protein